MHTLQENCAFTGAWCTNKVGTNGGLKNLSTWPETCFREVPCLVLQIKLKFTNSRCAFIEILLHYHTHLDAPNAHIEKFQELKPISPSEPPVSAVDLRDSLPKLQLYRPSNGSGFPIPSLASPLHPPELRAACPKSKIPAALPESTVPPSKATARPPEPPVSPLESSAPPPASPLSPPYPLFYRTSPNSFT